MSTTRVVCRALLFINNFLKTGGEPCVTCFSIFRYSSLFVGFASLDAAEGSSGTPIGDDLQAKRDVASYLGEMYDSSTAGGFSLEGVREKCKYIEMDVEKVSGNSEDVAAFKDLLGKLKKAKTEDKVKELCAKMAGLLELPEVWQTQLVRDNKK